MEEVLVNKINKKYPFVRPRIRWVGVMTQYIKNIKEESIFDDVYDREMWKGFAMTVMALNGLTN